MSAPLFEELQSIAGPVSRETYGRLLAFEQLVEKWSSRLNLIGASTRADIWRRHVLDSAQLVKLSKAPDWIDIGSGAGFPGIVVAILLYPTGCRIHLVESNQKKASFLRIAAGELGLSARVHAARAETVLSSLKAGVLTSRALAPLKDLLRIGRSQLQGDAVGLFHKGREYRSEVDEADSVWRFDMLEHRNEVLPEGVILEIRNLRPRPAAG